MILSLVVDCVEQQAFVSTVLFDVLIDRLGGCVGLCGEFIDADLVVGEVTDERPDRAERDPSSASPRSCRSR